MGNRKKGEIKVSMHYLLSRLLPFSRLIIKYLLRTALVVQTVKNLPAMRETWVQSLGWEDPLEEGMTTRSSILAWRIPWTEETCRLQCMGSQRDGHD